MRRRWIRFAPMETFERVFPAAGGGEGGTQGFTVTGSHRFSIYAEVSTGMIVKGFDNNNQNEVLTFSKIPQTINIPGVGNRQCNLFTSPAVSTSDEIRLYRLRLSWNVDGYLGLSSTPVITSGVNQGTGGQAGRETRVTANIAYPGASNGLSLSDFAILHRASQEEGNEGGTCVNTPNCSGPTSGWTHQSPSNEFTSDNFEEFIDPYPINWMLLSDVLSR